MIKIDEVETYGWQAAIRGMRNPKIPGIRAIQLNVVAAIRTVLHLTTNSVLEMQT